MSRAGLATALHLVGYPAAVVVISRLVPVFRERRTSWFLAHEAGAAAIVGGWALRGNSGAVAVNATWLVGVAAAWALTSRRRS